MLPDVGEVRRQSSIPTRLVVCSTPLASPPHCSAILFRKLEKRGARTNFRAVRLPARCARFLQLAGSMFAVVGLVALLSSSRQDTEVRYGAPSALQTPLVHAAMPLETGAPTRVSLNRRGTADTEAAVLLLPYRVPSSPFPGHPRVILVQRLAGPREVLRTCVRCSYPWRRRHQPASLLAQLQRVTLTWHTP